MLEYRYYIKELVKKDENTVILELGDLRGIPVFDFEPGQYVMLSYKNKNGRVTQRHAFSIASSPSDRKSIRLGIRVNGSFTKGLMKFKAGEEIFISGPYGQFTFQKEKHLDLVFIAGGVGITPFVSALRYAAHHHLPNKLTLLYSNRTLASALFLEEIADLARQNENMRVLFSLTDEKLPNGAVNMTSQRFSAKNMRDFIGTIQGKTFFVCGPENFMSAMQDNLQSLGVDSSQIETEGFSMIPDGGWTVKLRNTAYALSFAMVVFLLPLYFIYKPGKSTVNSNVNSSPITTDSSPIEPPTSTAVVPAVIPEANNPSSAKTIPVAPAPSRTTRTS